MNINETSARRLKRAALSSLPSRIEKEQEFNYANYENVSNPEKLRDEVVGAFMRTEHARYIVQTVPDKKNIKARHAIPKNGDFIDE